jgi:hypothetical protein
MKGRAQKNEFAVLPENTVKMLPELEPVQGAARPSVFSEMTATRQHDPEPLYSLVEPSLTGPGFEAENVLVVETPAAAPAARLFEGLIQEAAIVRRLHPDSLTVVLKPDSETEIFVRLETRDGRLEASARCDRGDYQQLNAHWSELRRCLQQQGIHLLDLQQRPEGMSYSPSGAWSQARQQDRRPEEHQGDSSRIPQPRRARKNVADHLSLVTSALNPNHLLESWA